MGVVETIALAMGIGWASGINLYAAIATLGILQLTGNIVLPPELQIVAHPWVLGAAVLMYCVEFFADKVPGVDTGWDTIHTFIRIPAGAVLAASAVGPVSDPAALAAGLVGGLFATGSHVLKTGARVVINTSPEPVTNWTASVAEDVMVVSGVWAALYHPWLFLAGLGGFVALSIWLAPKIWRGVRWLGSALARLVRGGEPIALPARASTSEENGAPAPPAG